MAPPEKRKRPPLSTVWREARTLVFAHRYRLALALGLMLLNRISGLFLPWAPKYLIDDIIGKNQPDKLLWLALAAGAATLVQAATSFSLSQVLGVAAQRAINDLREEVQAHVLRLPVSYFDSNPSGALISRIMTDAEGIRNLVGTGIVQLVGGMVTAVLAVGALFYLNWQLTSVIIVILAIFGACMAFTFTYVRPMFRERNKLIAEITARLAETLGGIRVIKAYVGEPREQRIFAGGVDRLFNKVKQSMTAISGLTAFSTLIVGAVSMLMIIFGGQAIIAGKMSVGDFFMYIAFTGMVVAPVVQIASIGTQISEAFAGLDRIREIKLLITEDADDEGREKCADIHGDVVFDKVIFEYTKGHPVLKEVSFRAAAGSTTALVGSSGSGKSTLISLVMAFHRALSGTISVDGRDLSTLKLRDYRSHLGVVMQENFLFDGSIAENIGFAHPDATRDEIREVGRIAHCEEFVQQFEKGYDTMVGERGVKLSGGQRQRIAIARALLAEPRILILDEATSSLDSETEAMIQESLQALRRGRTTFVIAHRLSTIRSADQILVLEAGQIVERGSHAQLLAMGGRYRQLYDKQYHFEHERFINPGEDFTPEPVKVRVTQPRATGLLGN